MKQVHIHLYRTADMLAAELSSGPRQNVRPVYAHMPLAPVSAEALASWARSIGVRYCEPRPHVTTAYCRSPVLVAPTYRTRDNAHGLVVPPGGRSIARFGQQLVLLLGGDEIRRRWQAWIDAGASWDYPDYQPHVTFADLKHQEGAAIDTSAPPFDEPITLLPEVVERPRDSY